MQPRAGLSDAINCISKRAAGCKIAKLGDSILGELRMRGRARIRGMDACCGRLLQRVHDGIHVGAHKAEVGVRAAARSAQRAAVERGRYFGVGLIGDALG